MKRAYYDIKPSNYEAVGNGSHMYRWDIKEEKVTDQMAVAEGDEHQPGERIQYSCLEVVVWAPVTSNGILQAVLEAKFPNNREQKYINEYNAALLGYYGDEGSDEAQEKINAYKEFLYQRALLKTQVDEDCKKLGII
ncbi:MAG: hypothetical protein IKU25_00175 [Clostridia bacterium]|nr:hypothetical protein [Clostridia bacterium]